MHRISTKCTADQSVLLTVSIDICMSTYLPLLFGTYCVHIYIYIYTYMIMILTKSPQICQDY